MANTSAWLIVPSGDCDIPSAWHSIRRPVCRRYARRQVHRRVRARSQAGRGPCRLADRGGRGPRPAPNARAMDGRTGTMARHPRRRADRRPVDRRRDRPRLRHARGPSRPPAFGRGQRTDGMTRPPRARRPVWSDALTRPLAAVIPIRWRRRRCASSKGFHTVAFVVIGGSILVYTWDGATRRTGRRAGWPPPSRSPRRSSTRATTSACPLTPLAETLGAESGSVIQIDPPLMLDQRPRAPDRRFDPHPRVGPARSRMAATRSFAGTVMGWAIARTTRAPPASSTPSTRRPARSPGCSRSTMSSR